MRYSYPTGGETGRKPSPSRITGVGPGDGGRSIGTGPGRRATQIAVQANRPLDVDICQVLDTDVAGYGVRREAIRILVLEAQTGKDLGEYVTVDLHVAEVGAGHVEQAHPAVQYRVSAFLPEMSSLRKFQRQPAGTRVSVAYQVAVPLHGDRGPAVDTKGGIGAGEGGRAG